MTERHAAQPPLAGRYGWTVVVALLALCPNIVLTTAFSLLQKPLTTDLHLSKTLLQTTEGLSNAGYAFGAVFAAYLMQKFRQRVLFIVTESLFLVASLLAATAWAPAPFVVGRILQGFTTGLMLVIALPPLITQFPVRRLPTTAGAVNIGLFGAVTVGPLLGGAAAAGHGWRLLFGSLVGLALVALVLAVLTLRRQPPFNPDQPADISAFLLAAAATVLPFFGVSQLTSAAWTSPIVWAPVVVGLAALAALIVSQYRRREPLMPVKALSTSLPVCGTLTAMVAGAAFVTLLELTTTSLLMVHHGTPLATGLLFWPMVAGVLITAVVFALLFRTRYLPLLVVVGLLVLVGGGIILSLSTSHVAVLAGTGLLGLGAGATVSPGLFLAAFGVPSKNVGRAFALVELLRSEAAYLVGPVLLYIAMQSSSSLGAGLRLSSWITVGGLAVGTLVIVGLYLASGTQPHRPDVEGWLGGDDQALHSPATAGLVRPLVADAGRRAADVVRGPG